MNDKPLFVFEMANNHQGSVEHGKRIISEIRKICDDFPQYDYAFKFQYRNLDTFIHPDYQNRMDIKNVKRFQDTRLSIDEFNELFDFVKDNKFFTICTPFDEKSVEEIEKQKYDYMKVASCSFTDWPLLEKVAEAKMPVIASAAGSTIEDIRRVVSFFSNRNINFSLLHCVAEYPTVNENLEMNQISFYRQQFPGIRIGFSTHEDPKVTLPVQLAVAKGAKIFEKHVGVPTEDITLNGYSASPSQVRDWLEAATVAFDACGTESGRYCSSEKEQADLRALRRGVFAADDGLNGEINLNNTFLAFPCVEGQLTANDLSKYNKICINKEAKLKKNAPIMKKDVTIHNISEIMIGVIGDITALLRDSNVVIPSGSKCEISHHYGISEYRQTGVAMISLINREYCKKVLVVLPGQKHPVHYHKQKEETFVVLHGELNIVVGDKEKLLHKGDIMTIERSVPHSFKSEKGCIFEEISTTHFENDSYYESEDDFVNPRKTTVYFEDNI